MGFKEGGGLGRFGQSRTAPIEESKQKGRRGLGLVLADIDRSQIKYDPTTEVRITWSRFVLLFFSIYSMYYSY